MRYRNVMSRRTFLRGTGTVAIGLPFLDAMRARSVYGAPPEPPVRAITAFFGLGVPKEIQAEGLEGALEPLAPFADKLAFLRGINLFEADGRANNHFDGGGSIFVGVEPQSDSLAGGPSVDQVLRAGVYGSELPEGASPTLVMGSFFRRSRLTRYIHSWRPDGSPVDVPQETPEDLFDRVFGSAEPSSDDPAVARQQRYRRSVLDTVLEQYRSLSGPASPLGAGTRARIADHFERIRELEQRVFAAPQPTDCELPNAPNEVDLLRGQDPDPSGEGVDIALDEWQARWRLMADIYVAAFRCDRVRFGSTLFQSAGERIRLRGEYNYRGRQIYTFDDERDRGRGGADGCSHEFWHRYQASNPNTEMRHHIHFMMAQMAYLLERLDDDAYPDENGGTLLDNAMLMLGTELGDGNPHNLESVFHMVSRCNERFRAGTFDLDGEGLDVYNTVLAAYGVDQRMGPAGRSGRILDEIRA